MLSNVFFWHEWRKNEAYDHICMNFQFFGIQNGKRRLVGDILSVQAANDKEKKKWIKANVFTLFFTWITIKSIFWQIIINK